MNYIVFSAADASQWGWKPQEGDEYLSTTDLVWRPHPLGGDSAFEVEEINRRPEHSVTTDLLVQMQSLRNEVIKLDIEVRSLKQELRIINPLS
jgi:hypothetical protein